MRSTIHKHLESLTTMTVTTILGSPRKRGNTATILTIFEEFIRAHHAVERITLSSPSINGCRGCEACQRMVDKPGCIQHDQISEVLVRILHSDLIVYASPVYVWDFSAQMKALIDRHCCFVKWKHGEEIHSPLHGKQTALLATCGGDAENNADLIQEIFCREMAYLHCRIVGKYIVPHCTLPSKLGDTAQHVARQMVTDVLQASPVL